MITKGKKALLAALLFALLLISFALGSYKRHVVKEDGKRN